MKSRKAKKKNNGSSNFGFKLVGTISKNTIFSDTFVDYVPFKSILLKIALKGRQKLV